jgi:hypothetical protein
VLDFILAILALFLPSCGRKTFEVPIIRCRDFFLFLLAWNEWLAALLVVEWATKMSVVKDCQRYAAQCLQDARSTTDHQRRVFLVEMAQAWQRLAEREMNAKGGHAHSGSEFDRGD